MAAGVVPQSSCNFNLIDIIDRDDIHAEYVHNKRVDSRLDSEFAQVSAISEQHTHGERLICQYNGFKCQLENEYFCS